MLPLFFLLALQSDPQAPFLRWGSATSGEPYPHRGPRTGGDRISAAPVCDPRGRWLAVPLESGEVELVDLESSESKRWGRIGRGQVEGAAFDPVGAKLAVWNWTEGVSVRAVPSGDVLARLADRTEQTFWKRLAFSCDGERLLAWEWTSYALLFDARSGELVARLANEPVGTDEVPATLFGPGSEGLPSAVYFADWDPTGERIVTASGDGLRSWDARSGARIESPLDGAPGASSFAFDATGARIALASDRVRVLDARDGHELASLGFDPDLFGGENPPACVAFHPSGRFLITGEAEWGQVVVWTLDQDGLTWHRGSLSTQGFSAARFEKGGAWIALTGSEPKARASQIVELASGRSIFTSELGADSWLTASPGGLRIVDACSTELRIYDGARLRPLLVR